MRNYLILLLTLCLSQLSFSQVTIESSTLPQIGDVLKYTTFTGLDDTLSYKENGENLSWSFSDFNITGSEEEDYMDITNTIYADSFPDANIIVELSDFTAAGKLTSNTLEMVGIPDLGFGGFGIEGITNLEDPFIIRATPFSYGDSYDDGFSFKIQFSSEEIPGLDSIEIPLPGATLDSIRVVTSVYKSETATAWGTLNLNGNNIDVLKVEQVDSTDILFELGINLFGTLTWIDLAQLLGEFGGGDLGIPSSQNSYTYKFLAADSKASILEITEDRFTDSLGVDFLNVSGRISSDITSSNQNISFEESGTKVFPNPAADHIRIESIENYGMMADLELWTMDGKLVWSQQNFDLKNPVSTAQFNSGLYLLRIVSDHQIETVELQIER